LFKTLSFLDCIIVGSLSERKGGMKEGRKGGREGKEGTHT